MKRIISIILTLAMCLSAVALLASCSAGESAYEIAVRHGYTGTEEEWYASLKGDKGDTGAAGAQGDKGDKGDKGETGDAGADGVKGDKGDKGETGDKGANGAHGTDGYNGNAGREIEFNVTPDEIQWRYKGEDEWKTLVTIADLKGDKGEQGETGDKGADGLSPTIGENGNWWIGNVDTGVYAGNKKEDGTTVVVNCTSLSFVEGACSIWANGTVPSLKIKYVLEDEAGNIVREGITNVTKDMFVGDYVFNGANTYEGIYVKFLGYQNEEPITLTINTTYDLVSPRVYAIGDEPVYQISKTVAGQEPEIITVTPDMIVKSNVNTSKSGKYSITINSPDGVPETFEIVVDGRIMSIADALAAKDGTEAVISGTVTGFYEEWSSYNNCSPYITDEEGNTIIVFRTKTKVGIGDKITVEGTIVDYKGTNQIDKENSKVTIDVAHVCTEFAPANCDKGSHCVVCGLENGVDEALKHNFENDVCVNCEKTRREVYTVTVAEAIAIAKGLASGAETTESYWITGVITGFSNTTYGNAYIKDGSTNTSFTIYGMYTEDGVRYDAMTVKPVKGDTITIYGKILNYKGTTPEISNGTLVEHIPHEHEYTEATCTIAAVCTICGANGEGALNHIDDNGDNVCDRENCKADLAVTIYEETFSIAANKGDLSGKTITWNSENFEFVGTQGTNTNAIRTSDTDHFRVYKGSTFAISGKDGQKITKVVITCTSGSYATDCSKSLTTAGATVSVSGSVVTIEFANGVDSVDFVAVAQFRLNKIVISYTN